MTNSKKPKFIHMKNKILKIDGLNSEIICYFLDEKNSNNVIRVSTIKLDVIFKILAANYKTDKKTA